MLSDRAMPKSSRRSKPAPSCISVPTKFPGDYDVFVATLPDMVRTVSNFDLNYLWKRAQENARRAKALETKADELVGLLQRLGDELGALGLTFEDLVAYERAARGGEPFPHEPDYLLPERYRRNSKPTD